MEKSGEEEQITIKFVRIKSIKISPYMLIFNNLYENKQGHRQVVCVMRDQTIPATLPYTAVYIQYILPYTPVYIYLVKSN